MRKETVLAKVLNEFALHPERRCSDNKGRCEYSPKRLLGLEDISRGCAIGIFMTQKQKDICNELEINTSVCGLKDDHIGVFPKKLLNVDIDFLRDIQSLHDTSENWDGKCLSWIGCGKLKELMNYHDLNKSKINRYLNEDVKEWFNAVYI